MRAELLWTVALAVCAPAATFGDDDLPPTEGESVDIDFLEYLGSLVQDGDEWLDASDVSFPAEPARAANDDPLGLPPEWEN